LTRPDAHRGVLRVAHAKLDASERDRVAEVGLVAGAEDRVARDGVVGLGERDESVQVAPRNVLEHRDLGEELPRLRGLGHGRSEPIASPEVKARRAPSAFVKRYLASGAAFSSTTGMVAARS